MTEKHYRWDAKGKARPTQLEPPGDWFIWLILAGRGWGKTRTGAEWVRSQVELGKCGRLALIAQDAGDARDVMVEGESGLLKISHPDRRPTYEPSKRRLTWAHNGAQATTYAADDPDALRGPQHDGFWGDEPAKWRYAQEAFDNLMFGLRIGTHPRGVLTGTPKPVPFIKRLIKRGGVHITKGTTHENLDNLAPSFRDTILAYEGTRLGRQELHAELLEDVEGALWTYDLIEAGRMAPGDFYKQEQNVLSA